MPSVKQLILCLSLLTLHAADTPNWPQFRGLSGAGSAASDATPPVEFSATRNLVWKADSGSGHGSLCIWGGRIFLLSYDAAGKKFETVALDRAKGTVLWRQGIDAKELEAFHAISNPATATPATDGERVYAYFGSYGVAAYSLEGKPVWQQPLGKANVSFGSGASPVVSGGLVLLYTGPQGGLSALDARDGTVKWKAALNQLSYATPVVWNSQVVIHAQGIAAGFDLRDGSRQWWVSANTNGTATPVAREGMLYIPAWSNTGDASYLPPLPTWEELAKKYDADKDGRISEKELGEDVFLIRRPEVPDDTPSAHITAKRFFSQLDMDHDGHLSQKEWDLVRMMIGIMVRPHGLMAVKAGGHGDITPTHVAWTERKNVPEVPSPLLLGDRVYMVSNGGIVTCMDAGDGHIIFRGRLGAPGEYYASPVTAAGRVYFASRDGVVTVITGGDELKVLARNDLAEQIFATPAIIGDTLYLRTVAHVMAFRSGK